MKRLALVLSDYKKNEYNLTFKEKPPWWGGDLQTIRNFLCAGEVELPGHSKTLIILTNDGSGDEIIAILDTPNNDIKGPLIMLVHGLTGSDKSAYMVATSRYHLLQGRRVLRLNLRGVGPTAKICQKHYHGGHITDISDALDYLDDDVKSKGIFIIGFSLGGNILLNFLAKNNDYDLLGAASVSASIDPISAAKKLLSKRNAIYQSRLLRHMKEEYLSKRNDLSDIEKEIMLNSKSIYEFDDKITGPKNGYEDAEDYYFQTKSARKMECIKIPTLIISARNDPWIPIEAYEIIKKNAPENITVLITDGGGHVGFHEKGQADTWYDRKIDAFISSLI